MISTFRMSVCQTTVSQNIWCLQDFGNNVICALVGFLVLLAFNDCIAVYFLLVIAIR